MGSAKHSAVATSAPRNPLSLLVAPDATRCIPSPSGRVCRQYGISHQELLPAPMVASPQKNRVGNEEILGR